MKKPPLEEVKEKFKNAETVESPINSDSYHIDTEKYGVEFKLFHYRQSDNGTGAEWLLWHSDKGYAKILTYKNKVRPIEPDLFNKPILSLNDLLSVWSSNGEIEFYKNSPLFKSFENLAKKKLGLDVLEVGKVYKTSGCIFNYQKENKSYGVNHKGMWIDWTWIVEGKSIINKEWNPEPATTEEWVTAIKKECEKRGLDSEKGNFKCLHDKRFTDLLLPVYLKKTDTLQTKHGVIYEKGVFAEVVDRETDFSKDMKKISETLDKYSSDYNYKFEITPK